MRNVLITVEYDGKNFSGWQLQPELRTVQGVLEEALSKFTGTEIQISGTSRTDSGVHALGQCASFKGDFTIPLDNLMRAVNNYLAGGMNAIQPIGDVRIVDIKEMPLDFHARFDCKGKTYRYVICNDKEMPVFRKDYCYLVKHPLDIDLMKKGAEYIVGTHDFKAFQAAGSQPRETTVRTIKALTVEKVEGDVVIEVTGDGFLYNMVRIIVGTLVDVGHGKKKPEDVKSIIESLDRNNAGHTAPACGLYLKEIYFKEI